MEEQIKIIEIPGFIKVKIIKIHDKYCAYYVVDYNNEYFYADEDEFLKTYLKASISFTLSLDIPFTINNFNVEHLEEAINKLHKELTKDRIPRAEKEQIYYVIASDFTIRRFIELNDNVDNRQHRAYNYFVSESKAKEFASKMQEYLMELWKEELNNGN